jgi:putative transposase
MVKKYKVHVLNYIITSNHIHLLLSADNINDISSGMQFVEGTIAQKYNRLKKREGSFWRDRYHITLVENGYHLSRCIFYIDFNMVRAGVVKHPEEWKWSGYDELSGQRQRYKVIDIDNLLKCLGIKNVEIFFDWYNNTIRYELDKYHVRQDYWSSSLAVGSEDWINELGIYIPRNKKVLSVVPHEETTKVMESEATYILKTSKRSASYFTRSLK